MEVEETDLDLSDREISSMSEIQGLETLTHLKSLILHNNDLAEIDYHTLSKLPDLKVLIFSSNKLTSTKGIQTLSSLEKLEIISFHSNSITKIPGIRKLEHVKTIDLQNNPIYEKIKFQDFFLFKRKVTMEDVLEYTKLHPGKNAEWKIMEAFMGKKIPQEMRDQVKRNPYPSFTPEAQAERMWRESRSTDDNSNRVLKGFGGACLCLILSVIIRILIRLI